LARMQSVRNRALPLVGAGLSVLLAIWIVLAPAEARLGNVVKLVYVHGALVWVGLVAFSFAGLLGLVALLVRWPVWYRGTEAAGLAALGLWVLYVLSSMIVTDLTWGQLIAWNEPRVRATALILGAVIVVTLVTRMVNNLDFTAAANLLMGAVPWVVVHRAGVIRHPVNPIGGSGSAAIQDYYLLIVVTVTGLAATLIAWLWVTAQLKERKNHVSD
jgi:hypothetical protein